jgi:hypothetical protein
MRACVLGVILVAVVAGVVLGGCGAATTTSLPSPSAAGPASPSPSAAPTSPDPSPAGPAVSPDASASAAAASPSPVPASASPSPSAADATDPPPPPGSELLTVLQCPAARPASPACLDASGTISLGSARVGSPKTFVLRVRNTGATDSPPVTLVLFTFEPPAIGALIRPTSCGGGCSLGSDRYAVAWPAVPGGATRELTLTFSPLAAQPSGSLFMWALYAATPVQVRAYGAIYVSAAFASGKAAATVLAR